MDANNWRPNAPGGEPPMMDTVDWRTQLSPDSRHRIVNKIMETLKRHLPFSGPEGLQELKKIAVRFEEKIYTAASSQPDYLRKISLKMLTMENKSQNAVPNSLPANSSGNSNRLPDTASLDAAAQTGQANVGDWQEEVYQKVKQMKDAYLPEMAELYLKVAAKVQQQDSLSQLKSDQLDKLKFFKNMVERMIQVLQMPKSSITPALKDKLGVYEKQILNVLNTSRPRKQVSSM